MGRQGSSRSSPLRPTGRLDLRLSTVFKDSHGAGTMQHLLNKSLEKAANLGHRMLMLTRSADTAMYACELCKLSFVIGNPAVLHPRLQKPRSLEVIAGIALTTPCGVAPSE